jgi:cysteine synthase A
MNRPIGHDRPAKQMILEAEKRGDLAGRAREATAGNTGIGFALVAGARGAAR